MMQRVLSKFARNDRGATAVEFAIILPVLLLFVFGIIEWGLYMYNRQVITNAAREGARHGVLMRQLPRDATLEDIEICNRVDDFAATWLVTFGPDELSCDPLEDIIRNPAASTDFETVLRVEVEFDYDFLFLSVPPLNLGPLPIRSVATMRME